MIKRSHLTARLTKALARSRVTTMLGPRQCGKSTLAQQIVPPNSVNYFDLEQPKDLVRLEQPMNALQSLQGTVVIDEIHRCPELFPMLRVLADRVPLPARFLILGSAAPRLLRQSSESLAGRQERIHLTGFTLSEVGLEAHAKHWLRGGFPRSFLAADTEDSWAWRENYVQDMLIHDLPDWGMTLPASALQRLWTLLAHYHGQTWQVSEPSRMLGISEPTTRRYLDILTDLFVIRQLPPWHANLKKRQVKSPKVYFRDTGLLHHLLGIRTEKELLVHPKCGASWEGYVIEEILKVVEPQEAFFWATHQGAEIDLIMIKEGRMLGVECKQVDAPKMTPSMHIALEDLKLERIAVVYPGKVRYPLVPRVEVVPMKDAMLGMDGLFPKELN